MPSDSRRSRKLSMTIRPLVFGLGSLRFPGFDALSSKTKDQKPKTASNAKNPALNNAGLQSRLKFFGFVVSNYPSCLAVCFTWPQVALTHHVCHGCLYAAATGGVKHLECAGRHTPNLRP